MTDSARYSVIISDEYQSGFERQQVQDAFAALFKIPPEKAAKVLEGQRVLKKETDLRTAQVYKKKLEAIGLVVTLKERLPAPPPMSLSLVPEDEEAQAKASDAVDTVTCPKCELEQPADAERCQGCGVFLHKVMKPSSDGTAPTQQVSQAAGSAESPQYSAREGLTTAGLVAGVVAAVLGALAWQFIASTFGFELGLVAWAVGGLIGFSVGAAGGNGNSAGVAAGVLALVAILGGKYMIYSNFTDQLDEIMSGSVEEMRFVYDAQKEMADAFAAAATDDDSLRRFMAESGYSEHADPSEVTQEEIDFFVQYVQPQLAGFSGEQPSYEEWYASTLEPAFSSLTPMGLFAASFGLLDILFLVLGVATAYRLGRGGFSE